MQAHFSNPYDINLRVDQIKLGLKCDSLQMSPFYRPAILLKRVWETNSFYWGANYEVGKQQPSTMQWDFTLSLRGTIPDTDSIWY